MKADHATLVVTYFNEMEACKESKRIIINSSGGGNLGHSVVDEDIKRYLRAAGILKTKSTLPDLVHDEAEEQYPA